MDWRDFRAKLVMQEQQNTLSRSPSSSKPSDSWAYESGDVIETGSLIVSHPSQDFACGGLRQQYFYKSVVLVVEHTPTFTKGLILNRPTDQTLKDDHGEDWKVWYGGDVQGMESDNESYLCLHRLGKNSAPNSNKTSPHLASELSTPVLQDIASTPWEIAQVLVDAGEAIREDFWLCAGYSGWGPGQLQNELQRGNWFVVQTDVESVWSMIGQDLTSPAGTDMWCQVMKRIGKQDMTTCMPDQKFKDEMLKQWVTQKLRKPKPSTGTSSKDKEHDLSSTKRPKPLCNLRPGMLVRASSPILLDEQVFHQSLVLILVHNDEMTSGVVLNRPSSKSVEIAGTSLPLRFGGRFGVEGKGKPELWLHCNKDLQDAKVGQPVSDDETSIFWKCVREDAESAIKVGLAKPRDFVVVEGLSVWNNKQSINGQKPSSAVEIDAFFAEVDDGGIDIVWKLLLAQEPLNKNNAAENLEAANAAWMISGDAAWMFTGGSSKFGFSSHMRTLEQQHVQSLAYSALDRWIRLFLLKP
jgi:putative AlgH/UPF0301 family transcriptional regulator